MNVLLSAFQIVVLLFSAIIHEIFHGFFAYYYGDPTAKDDGRLTLNPIRHLEFFGSIVLPLSLFLVSGGQFIFGWARPVSINPANLKNPKKDMGIIALAGPLANFLIAILFGLIYRLLSLTTLFIGLPTLPVLVEAIIYINLLLGVFNLVPLPPLDGSNVLFAFLPAKYRNIELFLRTNALFLILIFLFFGFRLIQPIIYFLFTLLVG